MPPRPRTRILRAGDGRRRRMHNPCLPSSRSIAHTRPARARPLPHTIPAVGRLAGACMGILAALAFAAAPVAAAPLPGGIVGPPGISAPKFGDFRAVLAQGEGQTVNAADLASYEALGTPPATFTNQTPLYAGIMPHASSLTPADLNVFYRNTNFGAMPG